MRWKRAHESGRFASPDDGTTAPEDLLEQAERAFERGDFATARLLARRVLAEIGPARGEATEVDLAERARALLARTGPDGLVVALGLVALFLAVAELLAAV